VTAALAVDTSVAIPLLVATHDAHADVVRWWAGRDLVLCGHAAVETYSVLTRLPADVRLAPVDAARLIRQRFGVPVVLSARATRALPETLSTMGIAGGAAYDALIALAAAESDAVLATRDGRARSTYERVGATVTVVG